MCIRQHRGHSGGFTLLELVIALTLIGTITVVLFSGLRLGGRLWERLDQEGERVAAIHSVQVLLRRTLGQAQLTFRTVDQGVVPLFSGDSARLEFVAPLSSHVGSPGLYLLRLQAEGDDEHKRLTLTRWLLHPEVLGGAPGNPRWEPMDLESAAAGEAPSALESGEAESPVYGRTELLGDLEAVEFSYFGQKPDGIEPEWHPDWVGVGTAPLLVRIRLGQAGRWWPEMLVPLAES